MRHVNHICFASAFITLSIHSHLLFLDSTIHLGSTPTIILLVITLTIVSDFVDLDIITRYLICIRNRRQELS